MGYVSLQYEFPQTTTTTTKREAKKQSGESGPVNLNLHIN